MESPQDGWPGREDDRRTSDVLRRFIADFPGDRVSVADLTAALGDRAYGVLLFVFALPNLMPVNLPGVSSVLGVPLILLSGRLACGYPAPWFPAWVAERSFSRAGLDRAFAWGLPHVERIERVLRPQLLGLTRGAGERLLGGVCLVLSMVLALPIPLANWLPSFAICILALALIEKDGVAYLLGMAIAVVGFLIAATVVLAFLEAFLFFLSRAVT